MSNRDFNVLIAALDPGTLASAATGTVAGDFIKGKAKATSLWLTVGSSYTAPTDGHFKTVAVKAGSTTLATVSLNSTASGGAGDITAFTWKDVSDAISVEAIPADSNLTAVVANTGNGEPVTGLKIRLIAEPMDA